LGRGAPHLSKKWLAPFNKVYTVRPQYYRNCDFTESSIKTSISPISPPQLCNG